MPIFLLFCFAFFTVQAAEIGLDALPWTDAMHFWTWSGHKQPFFPEGQEIMIGGGKFQRALCGRTPFSVTYNLDGKANAFSAMIGIDERHQPGNPEVPEVGTDVSFVVVADQEEVFRKVLVLGEKPVPVHIDLGDKSQLELRGEFGSRGFLFQHVAWANPVIEADSPAELRQTLKENREKYEAVRTRLPAYPPAPDWKNIRIRKVSWKGFSNAYRIENGKISLTVVPEFGGRIMEFAANNEASLLKNSVVSGKNALIPGLADDMAGGHFMRIQPRKEFFPNDPLLEHGSYEIAFPAEGTIVMTSEPSPLSHLQYEYAIEIEPEEAGITIQNRMINTAPFARMLGIWNITRLDSLLLEQITIPPQIQNPPREMQIASEGNAVAMVRTAEAISLNVDFASSTPTDFQELRCWSEERTIAITPKNGSSLKITYQDFTEDMGEEYPIHLFLSRVFTEAESHSPTLLVAPGKSISMTELWHITRNRKKP